MSLYKLAGRHAPGALFLRRTGLPALVIVILLLGTACGTTEDNGETVRPTPISGETPGGGAALTIEARDFQFAECKCQVRQGQVAQIRLMNKGSAPHSFRAYEDDEYKEAVDGAGIQPVEPGQSGTTTLNPPEAVNELFFRCEVHPAITGQIQIGV